MSRRIQNAMARLRATMTQQTRWTLSLLGILLLAALPSPAISTDTDGQHVVVMKQMHFSPAQITVEKGRTVEWKNEDIFSHSVTADDGSFDSGLIAPGNTWTLTVDHVGTMTYHCRPHPNMMAGIVVTAAGAQERGASNLGSLRWTPPRHPEQIHPILVNFTAALLPLALASDLLGRLFRRQSLHNAAWWMVLYAAAITPLTAIAGWWWKSKAGGDLPANIIKVHQWLGTAAAVLFVALALWRWSIQRRGVSPSAAYLACAGISVLALVYQGSLGGAMVFGK
jgi:plastocyanin/uncharacterized membrane protein